MSTIYDTIIIGGGHNGLVTAGLLAKAGQRILVLEQRNTLGGVAATEEIFPGFKVNVGAPDAGLFRPEVIEALDLTTHGLEFIESPVTAFAPQPNGPALTLWRDVKKSQNEIARFSEADAEKFPAFIEAVGYVTNLLEKLLLHTPPNLTLEQLDQILPWFQTKLGLERLGRRELADFARVLSLSTAEFLGEWFESEALKGLLGGAGITGSMQGPMSPGTAFLWFYHYLDGSHHGFKSSRFVRGGMGQLCAALAKAARQQGTEIQTGVEVQRVALSEGQATGVVLANGDHISAKTIVSNADPRRTFFKLVGAPHLEIRFMRQVRNIRYRGCTAKVNLSLRDLPNFAGNLAPSQISGHILISPSLEYLERAYDAAKYGRCSPAPYLDVVFPSLLDPSLAPSGQHLMSITMQYAPYHLRNADWDSRREALSDKIISTLAGYAPNLESLIIDRQVITPLDWERDYGLTEGSIFHGQMDLDQTLLMRPVPGFSQYRTPIKNLYLCGAGTHPGGGVTGAPGYNAAHQILRDTEQI